VEWWASSRGGNQPVQKREAAPMPRRRRRGLSGADRASTAAAWRLSAHTAGVVHATRLHAGTEDREV